jgi:hypothetical protein
MREEGESESPCRSHTRGTRTVQKEWRNQLLNAGSVDLVIEEERDQPTLPPPQLFPVEVRGPLVNWQQPQFCFRQPGFMSNESTANR